MKTLIIIVVLTAALISEAAAQVSELWRKSYTQEVESVLKSFSIDGEGNFIAGTVVLRTSPNFTDYVILKFDSGGDLLWRKEYNSATGYHDHLWDVYVDNDKNIYVTGLSTDYSHLGTLRTLKLSPGGNLLWERTDSTNTMQEVNGTSREAIIREASDGNIIICTNKNGVPYIIKYQPDGSPLLAGPIDVPSGFAFSYIRGFEINNSALQISCAYVDNTLYQYHTIGIRCDMNGDTLWTWRNRFGNNFWELPRGMVSDNSGSTFFLTEIMHNAATSRFAVTKAASSGSVMFDALYGSGTNNDRIIPAGIDLDNNGNIITASQKTSRVVGSNQYFEGLVVKFSPSGDSIWSRRIKTFGNNHVRPYHVQISADNSIFVSGAYPMVSSNTQFIHKFSPAGDSVWNFNPQGLSYWSAGRSSMTDSIGNIYLASNRQNGIMITKYGIPIGIQVLSSGIPEKFLLHQNYPNPFNPATRIRFSIPRFSEVKIVIYDVQGKEVTTLHEGNLTAGVYSIDWNAGNHPSGVYFVSIIAGSFSDTKKMLMIK